MADQFALKRIACRRDTATPPPRVMVVDRALGPCSRPSTRAQLEGNQHVGRTSTEAHLQLAAAAGRSRLSRASYRCPGSGPAAQAGRQLALDVQQPDVRQI